MLILEITFLKTANFGYRKVFIQITVTWEKSVLCWIISLSLHHSKEI